MSDFQDESDSGSIKKLGKGRLRKRIFSDEDIQKDDISLSLSLNDIHIESENKKITTKPKKERKTKKTSTVETEDRKPKKLRQSKRSDSEIVISDDKISDHLSLGSLQDDGQKETQNKQVPNKRNKKQKEQKMVPDNAAILERYQNDPRFQFQEDEKSEKSHFSHGEEQQFGGFDRKKEKRAPKAPTNGINNRSKFFKNLDENNIVEDVPIAEEEFVRDEKLIFEKKDDLEPAKENVKKKLFEVAQQYKQKVAVFDKSSDQMATLGSTILSRQLSNAEAPFQQFRRAQSMLEVDVTKEHPELEVIIPKVGTRDQVLDGTLYMNKMINLQRGNSNLLKMPTQNIQFFSNKSLSRSNFIKSIHDRNNDNKKIHKIDDMMRIFQHTNFNQINQKQPKNQEQSKIDTLQEVNIEDTSDEEINSKDLAKEQNDAERGSDEEEGYSGEELEGSEEDNQSEQQNIESSVMSVECTVERVKETSLQEEKIIEPEDLELKPQAVRKPDSSDGSEDENIDQEEIQAFSKLRKISLIKKQKKIEQQKAEQRKLEREKRKQEILKMREYIGKNFVEQEAELGSDNEEHDDVVKQVDDNDEEEEGDGYLADLIDEQIADIDEENEERAYKLYLKKLRDQDKEDIRKILRGDFKGRHDKNEIDKQFLDNHNEELDRIRRMEDCMRILQGKEENIDEDELAEVEVGISGLMSKQELIEQYKSEKAYQAHEKLKQQVKQMGKNNKQSAFQILNKTIMSKVVDKTQQKGKEILKPQKNQLVFGSFRNSNSYLGNNQKQVSFKSEQNLIEKNTNSNSVSLLTKQDNKKNQSVQNTSLNRLFASFQSSDQKNVPQLKNKSPHKVFLFKKK